MPLRSLVFVDLDPQAASFASERFDSLNDLAEVALVVGS